MSDAVSAPPPGTVTRVGGNTIEATTTSTTTVDLLSVSGLTIAAITPFIFLGVCRKTSGAGVNAYGGLTLNTINVLDAGFASGLFFAMVTNEAEAGSFHCIVSPRVTNYLRGITGTSQLVGPSFTSSTTDGAVDAAIPNAQITDVIIEGRTVNALVTCGLDELQVYTLATS